MWKHVISQKVLVDIRKMGTPLTSYLVPNSHVLSKSRFLSCRSAASLSCPKCPLCLAHDRCVARRFKAMLKAILFVDLPTFVWFLYNNLCNIHLSKLVNSLFRVANCFGDTASLEISSAFAEKCVFLSSQWTDIRETGNWSSESFSLPSPLLPWDL